MRRVRSSKAWPGAVSGTSWRPPLTVTKAKEPCWRRKEARMKRREVSHCQFIPKTRSNLCTHIKKKKHSSSSAINISTHAFTTGKTRTHYFHNTTQHNTTQHSNIPYLALGGHVVVGRIAGHLVLHSLGRGVGPVVPRVLHRVAHAWGEEVET